MILHADQLQLMRGATPLITDLSLTLRAGELVALIGPNGAGKSTLLKLLADLLPPTRGQITFDGHPFSRHNRRQRAQQIAYLAQGATIEWPLTVERVVALGRLPYLNAWQSPTTADTALLTSILTDTDLLPLRQRRVDTLSGGELARVLLARALATTPQIILADEPVAALDLAHQLQVMELLRRFCEQGGSGVVVLHDLRLAAHYSQRLLLLHHGRLVAEGSAAAVLTAERMATVFGVHAAPNSPDPLDWPWRSSPLLSSRLKECS